MSKHKLHSKEFITVINCLSENIYEQNKIAGWWDKPRSLSHCVQLASTEVAEASEGERKYLMDDHLPHHEMGKVELADILIRVLDFGGHFRLCYEPKISKFLNLRDRDNALEMHSDINALLSFFRIKQSPGLKAFCSIDLSYDEIYSILIKTIINCYYKLGYTDIFSVVEEKLNYNKNRADHKRENRAAEGGKKW